MHAQYAVHSIHYILSHHSENSSHTWTHRFWHRAASVSMRERNPKSIKKAAVMRKKVKDIQPRGKEKYYSVTTH